MSGLLQVLFCNCCAGGCDCGCVEDCRMVEHRAGAARPVPTYDAHKDTSHE